MLKKEFKRMVMRLFKNNDKQIHELNKSIYIVNGKKIGSRHKLKRNQDVIFEMRISIW